MPYFHQWDFLIFTDFYKLNCSRDMICQDLGGKTTLDTVTIHITACVSMCLRSTPDILPVTCCYQRAKITSCETTYNNDSIWQWGWKRPFVVPLYYQWVKKAKWWRRQKCFCLSCALTVEADLLIYCYYYFMRFILFKIINIKKRFNLKKEERD